jgi:preprotein translocase subunit SecF
LVSSVRSFLLSNGLSDTEADVKIKEFVAERNAEIRKIGIKNVIIGLVLLIVAVILIYMAATATSYSTVRGRGSALGFGLFAGLYGLWKLVNGIIYLVRSQSEEKSITEIE